MTELRISDDLRMPADAVTETFLLLGKRGSGKTNGAVVLAEEMHRAGLPFVVLDPIGAWWGVKASAEQGKPGIPVYVIGGDHGDVPLEPTAGALIADLVVEERISAVLDMFSWSNADRARFVADFGERLLKRNTEPLHVFMEEADALVPQRPYKGEERMLGAMDRLIRWGRQRGLGATVISQRSARVNKDATTQASTLVAFRTIGPQDRDVIEEWIKYHQGGAHRAEVMESLGELKDGEAWVWSPEWLGKLERVQWRRRWTFDSSATPKAGVKPVKPEMAAVDLERLRKDMAATIEKAKADDPRELRRQIANLTKEVQTLTHQVEKPEAQRVIEKEVEVEKIVEVPVAAPGLLDAIEKVTDTLGGYVQQLKAELERVGAPVPQYDGRGGSVSKPARNVSRPVTPARVSSAPIISAPKTHPAPAESNGTFHPTGSQQKILDALAWFEVIGMSPASRPQVGMVAGMKHTGGHYSNVVSSLRTAGVIDYSAAGMLALTDHGRAIATAPAAPVTSEALQDMLLRQLTGSQRKIIEVVIEAYPAALTRDELAERSAMNAGGGHFSNVVSSLRTLGLVDYAGPGMVVGTEALWLE